MNSISDIYLLILVAYHFLFAMYSNLAFVTFIFYLYSFCFYSPRWRFVLQTEISGKYNLPLYFCSLSLFFLSLFLPQGSVYCFKSEIWYSRFYWSRSTKNPAEPYWFVVVLPSQVFLSYHQLPSPLHQLSRFASACSIANFSWDLSWDCFSAFGPLEISLLIVFRSPVSCLTCWKD